MLRNICFNLTVSSGTNDAGVSWNLVDGAGNITLVGGAPYADTVCFPAVGGCTDAMACNYDALATLDNGTCDYSCVGCADPLALNYGGPSFTIDDGSCLYCNLSGASLTTNHLKFPDLTIRIPSGFWRTLTSV